MRIENVLVLERKDLREISGDKDMGNWIWSDFKVETRTPFEVYPFVVFIDTDGRTVVLKNRFGDQGEVL